MQIKDIPFAVMMIICFSKLYTSNLFKITIKNCVFKHNFSVTSRYWRAWSIDFVSHASQTSQHSPIIRQNSVSISRPSGPTCMLQLQIVFDLELIGCYSISYIIYRRTIHFTDSTIDPACTNYIEDKMPENETFTITKIVQL